MADDEIDSLLEAGIRAAVQAKQDENGRQDKDSGEKQQEGDRQHRSKSPLSSHHRHRERSRRSKSRSRSRSRRHRSGSRRHSSRRSRSRSRSRDRRRRHRRSRSHSRSRSRDRRSGSRSKSKPREPRARSTSAERAERAKQRELMELTRDHRTVFVGQLTQKVREKDLERFFRKLGKTENVLLIRDKFTNRSKGFAYVEMSNLEDVPKVLLMNGQVPDFQVFPIMVKASEAEKNFAAKKESTIIGGIDANGEAGNDPALNSQGGYTNRGSNANQTASALSAASRIYCGNLHTNITEDDLRVVFQAFGEVLSVTINRDEMGRSKGFGFIQFSNPQEANFAMSKGNGLELAGNYLKLGPVNENAFRGDQGFGNSGGNFGAGRGGPSGGWKLEDDDGTGLNLNAQSRSALMAKLAGNKDIFPTPGLSMPGIVPALAHDQGAANTQRAEQAAALIASLEIEGSESFCFVIKNMFDVVEEKRRGEPDWSVEIQQDVVEECGQFGAVLHSYVEQEKAGGLVYILFAGVDSAVCAAKKLHGRWFNKRQISVRYLSPQEYVGMFPEARSAVQQARESTQ